MDRFYKDILGFHLYWQGGAKVGARRLGHDASSKWIRLDRIHAVFA